MPLINIRVTEEERAELKRRAEGRNTTMSAMIRDNLNLEVKSRKPRRAQPAAETAKPAIEKPQRTDKERQDGEASAERVRSVETPPKPPTPRQVSSRTGLPVATAERLTKGKTVTIVDGKVHIDGRPL